MKKVFPRGFLRGSIITILIVGSAAFLALPIRGSQVDRWASIFLSREIGWTARLGGVAWRFGRELSFKTLELGDGDKTVLRAETGRISSVGPFFGKRRLVLERITLSPQAVPEAFRAQVSSSDLFSEGLAVDRLDLDISRTGDVLWVTVHECRGPLFKVRGGFSTMRGALNTVSIAVAVRETILSRFSDGFAARLMMGDPGWRVARFSYEEGLILVTGSRGPLFQATWIPQASPAAKS